MISGARRRALWFPYVGERLTQVDRFYFSFYVSCLSSSPYVTLAVLSPVNFTFYGSKMRTTKVYEHIQLKETTNKRLKIKREKSRFSKSESFFRYPRNSSRFCAASF